MESEAYARGVEAGALSARMAAYTELLREMDLRYQQRFDAQGSAVTAAMLAAEKAVTKAEIAAEKRFEGVNEFRSTLQDQASTFVTRVEFEAEHNALADRIRDLATRADRNEGRSSGLNSGWGYLVAAVTLVGVVVAIIVRLA